METDFDTDPEADKLEVAVTRAVETIGNPALRELVQSGRVLPPRLWGWK